MLVQQSETSLHVQVGMCCHLLPTVRQLIYYMRRQLKIQGNFIKQLILHFVISVSVFAVIIKSGSLLTYVGAIL